MQKILIAQLEQFSKNHEIIKVLKKAKKNNCYVVIDEAYFGFYNKSALALIKKYSNLIILRTFSKAYGLAGLRSGYIVSNKNNIDQLYKYRPMYEINSIAALASEEILKNERIQKNMLKKLMLEKNF